ncbi:MAG: class I SAM-dependent methyltransferase [Eubacteriales bacterium]|nr:class I SAM-dependent methyltransferase [Eubacteriales bacterium]
MIHLSKRLRTLCQMVTADSRLCDVGCDHALVPLALLEEGRIPSALAMDVARGPLLAAAANVEAHGYERQVQTRLSDGLGAYEIGEADTLVIAGMGGPLIREILEREPQKAQSFRELVLEPQSEVHEVRSALRGMGIGIVSEKMVEEDGKFYPVIRAVPGEKGVRPDWAAAFGGENPPEEAQRLRAEDAFGPALLRDADPVLLCWLRWRAQVNESVRRQLEQAMNQPAFDAASEKPAANAQEEPEGQTEQNSDTGDTARLQRQRQETRLARLAARLQEVEREASDLQNALRFFAP